MSPLFPRHEQDPLREMERRVAQEPGDQGPAQLQPTLPGAQIPDGLRVGLPGVNFPPAGANPIDQLGDADVAPGATVGILTVVVPVNLQLRLDGIGFGAEDESALRFLSWDLLDNGVPAQGYFGQAATIGTIEQTSPIFLHARGPTTVVLQVTPSLAAVVTYRFIARLKGWLFTEHSGVR